MIFALAMIAARKMHALETNTDVLRALVTIVALIVGVTRATMRWWRRTRFVFFRWLVTRRRRLSAQTVVILRVAHGRAKTGATRAHDARIVRSQPTVVKLSFVVIRAFAVQAEVFGTLVPIVAIRVFVALFFRTRRR